jgi:hypothetical protein
VGEVICYLEFCGHKSIDAKALIDVTGQGLGFARHEESLSQPIPHAFPILAFSFHDLHQVEEIKKKPGIFVAISGLASSPSSGAWRCHGYATLVPSPKRKVICALFSRPNRRPAESAKKGTMIQPGFEPGSGATCGWQAPMIPLHY